MKSLAAPPLCSLAALAALGAGCSRAPEAVIIDGQAFGVIDDDFHRRWWQYLERGISWADGELYQRAEADLRTCLQFRQTDSRRARTYGMRFVQAFPNRELGAVLLAQGRLDEARRYLERSLEQEPSAKAEHLLRLLERRQGRDSGYSPARAGERHEALLQIEQSVALDDGGRQVSGRWQAPPGHHLAISDGAGAVLGAADETGAFDLRLPAGAELLLSDADSGAVLARAGSSAGVQARLRLDGPNDGHIQSQPRAWYRFTAQHEAGIDALRFRVDGEEQVHLQGEGSENIAGTVELRLHEGVNLVIATLETGSGSVTVQRRVHVQPPGHPAARLRATALLLPLLSATDSQSHTQGDSALLIALVEDARFRYIDERADELLARELALADAGYIDRVTAARAGRQLEARFVLAGTIRPSRTDAECFLRVVDASSGAVLATADAYARITEAAELGAFCQTLAGRLRQAVPVLSGRLRSDGETVQELGIRQDHAVDGSMRFHLVEAITAEHSRSHGTVRIELHPEGADLAGAAPTWDGTIVSE